MCVLRFWWMSAVILPSVLLIMESRSYSDDTLKTKVQWFLTFFYCWSFRHTSPYGRQIYQCKIHKNVFIKCLGLNILTLSGRIGKVVVSHAEGCKIESRLWLRCTYLYYARGAQGVLPMRVGGCDQSIGSTVSDAIVRSWLWSTATRSSLLGYFSRLLQVVDNWPHILW